MGCTVLSVPTCFVWMCVTPTKRRGVPLIRDCRTYSLLTAISAGKRRIEWFSSVEQCFREPSLGLSPSRFDQAPSTSSTLPRKSSASTDSGSQGALRTRGIGCPSGAWVPILNFDDRQHYSTAISNMFYPQTRRPRRTLDPREH